MEPPFVLVVDIFLYCQMVSVIFIRKSIPSSTNFFISMIFESFGHGILDLVGIGHGFLETVSFCISSLID